MAPRLAPFFRKERGMARFFFSFALLLIDLLQMAYTGKAKTVLDKFKVKVGDFVTVKRHGEELKGYLLPRFETGDQESFVIKLESGYNVGLNAKLVSEIQKIGPRMEIGKIPSLKVKETAGLPEVSFIATGGTIGTHVDYRTGGVYMCRTPQEVLATTPELAEIVNLRVAQPPFTIASEDVNPTHWQKLAKAIARELNSGAEGAIVTHGTDCLHYTAAAMSFMLRDLCKPVALVGAQRSPDRSSFDGSLNLVCAARYATSDMAEVATVMHGSSSDDYCYAIRGTKARKMHTSRRDAFRAINENPLAKILPSGSIEKLNENIRPRGSGMVRAETDFEPRTAFIKVYPGSDPALLNHLIEKRYRGVVIEGTGLGHVPTGMGGTHQGAGKKLSWIPAVKKAVDKGIVVAMTSQAIYGRTHPLVYRNLRLLHEAGAIHCEDMLPETAYVKLGWLLGQKIDTEDVKTHMLENFAGEINKRITEEEFLL